MLTHLPPDRLDREVMKKVLHLNSDLKQVAKWGTLLNEEVKAHRITFPIANGAELGVFDVAKAGASDGAVAALTDALALVDPYPINSLDDFLAQALDLIELAHAQDPAKYTTCKMPD